MTQARKVVVETRHLNVSIRGCPVLQDINLTLLENSFTGLIGPNGGGKTTLLRTLLGLIQPDSGEVRIEGRLLGSGRKHDWVMGYVPQQIRVDRRFPLSVLDAVVMGRYGTIGLGHRAGRRDREIALDSLDRVGLAHLARVRIGDLSGGEQQRVFIARALSASPKVLILDEPMAAVDVAAQDSFYRLIKKLQQTYSLTVVMATHDIGVVPIYCDAIACLNRALHLHGRPEEILKNDVFRKLYGSEVEVVMHGKVPHRMIGGHQHG